MGNTETISFREANIISNENYKPYQKISNENYGELTLVKNTSNKIFLMKEQNFHDLGEFQKELIFLKRKQNQKFHPNLIRIKQVKNHTKTFYCSKIYNLQYYLEFIEKNLYCEILNRKKQDKFYTEENLWFLAISLIKVLCFLQNNNQIYGNLRTNGIYINDNGVVKIFDNSIVNSINSYTLCLAKMQEKDVYISPEEMKDLKDQKIHSNNDKW